MVIDNFKFPNVSCDDSVTRANGARKGEIQSLRECEKAMSSLLLRLTSRRRVKAAAASEKVRAHNNSMSCPGTLDGLF